MAKILNIYVAKEIVTPFFLGLSVFTFILLMDKILDLTELIVNKGVKLGETLTLIAYILPSFLSVTIPMALLLAVLLAFGRLSTDEELTAAKSSGLGLFQIMPSVLVISMATFTAALLLMVYALPWGNHSFRIKMYDIVKRKADTGIVPGKIIDAFENMVLHIDEKDLSTGIFKGVLISEEKNGKASKIITAREGEVLTKPDDLAVTLRLYDGAIHLAGENQLQYKTVDFKTYDITLSMNFRENGNKSISKGDRELGVAEIKEKVNRLKEQGRPYNFLLVELHKKFSIPFACIVFSLIGVPLGIQGRRSGRAHGFTVSLLLITVYYIFLLGGEALGDKGTIPPFLAMWAPNIFFTGIGLYLLARANAEEEVKVLSLFDAGFSYIASALKGLFQKQRIK